LILNSFLWVEKGTHCSFNEAVKRRASGGAGVEVENDKLHEVEVV
jgi:hypothetical protein